jgi:hypothetical protein
MVGKRSTNRFQERELARAIRATRKAGESEARVEVDPASGRISVVLAKPGEAAESKVNPWDEVLQNDSDKKRSS